MTKLWTAEEEATLRRLVPMKGYRYTARRLGRSKDSVLHKARRLDVEFGESSGFTCLAKLALAADVSRGVLQNRAREDGVLTRRADGHHVRYTVPRTWANRFLREVKPLPRLYEELREAGYLLLTEVAERIGVSEDTCRRWLRGEHPEGLEDLVTRLEPISTNSCNGPTQLFNPHHVLEVETRLRKMRPQRGWLTPSEVGDVLGVSRHLARHTLIQLNLEPSLALHPTMQTWLPIHPPQHAEAVRKHLMSRAAPKSYLFLPFIAARHGLGEDEAEELVQALGFRVAIAKRLDGKPGFGKHVSEAAAEALVHHVETLRQEEQLQAA